ncbi:hypothetical protein K8S19_04480 [bacterium]|nr:hypothetical protein [bacterium]
MPSYDFDKIKFATDEPTFKRAVGLYTSGKVTGVEQVGGDYSAIVLGTVPYHVRVSARSYQHGDCTCYLGERDILCKHIVALAIYTVMAGKKLSDHDKQLSYHIVCSGRRGVFKENELTKIRKNITDAVQCIKPYRGSSRTWFANQDSLGEGCRRLSTIVSDFPVSMQTADVLVKLLIRLEKKVCFGGVDDSNGIVGGLAGELVALLEVFVKIDPLCIQAFKPLCRKESCFGWEESLVRIFDEGGI